MVETLFIPSRVVISIQQLVSEHVAFIDFFYINFIFRAYGKSTKNGFCEGELTSRPPYFDGTNYTYWKARKNYTY